MVSVRRLREMNPRMNQMLIRTKNILNNRLAFYNLLVINLSSTFTLVGSAVAVESRNVFVVFLVITIVHFHIYPFNHLLDLQNSISLLMQRWTVRHLIYFMNNNNFKCPNQNEIRLIKTNNGTHYLAKLSCITTFSFFIILTHAYIHCIYAISFILINSNGKAFLQLTAVFVYILGMHIIQIHDVAIETLWSLSYVHNTEAMFYKHIPCGCVSMGVRVCVCVRALVLLPSQLVWFDSISVQPQ